MKKVAFVRKHMQYTYIDICLDEGVRCLLVVAGQATRDGESDRSIYSLFPALCIHTYILN